MKINPSAGFDHYSTYTNAVKNGDLSLAKAQSEVRSTVAENGNTDKVTISENAAAKAELARMVKSVAGDVEAVGSPKCLEQLRVSVKNGSYYVPTEKLTDAIFRDSI